MNKKQLKATVKKLEKELIAHAEECFPRECCGVLLLKDQKIRYFPCRNIAKAGDFECDPSDIAKAMEEGEIVAVFHSHANGNPSFTESDISFCTEFPFILYALPAGKFDYLMPTKDIPPLVGRTYVSGKQDCFSLVRDYYLIEQDFDIADAHRWERWWEDSPLITKEGWESRGFEEVRGSLQEGDVIVMQNGGKVLDHLAVYIGDGKILHHCYNRLSRQDLYIGIWLKNTVYVLRRKNEEATDNS